MAEAPTPILRPKLAHWLFERDVSPAAAAAALKCSKQTILNITQPFSSTTRTVPHQDLLGRIVEWTDGEVGAADFYPPHLNGRADHIRTREDVQ